MKFAVIGHPISHSLSPIMHSANFSNLSLNYTYEPLDILLTNSTYLETPLLKRNLVDLMSLSLIKSG